jgi:putative ABC transport system permease protein
MHLGVERQLLVSAARSTIQLFLIGLVLKVLFDNVHLPLGGADGGGDDHRSPGAR